MCPKVWRSSVAAGPSGIAQQRRAPLSPSKTPPAVRSCASMRTPGRSGADGSSPARPPRAPAAPRCRRSGPCSTRSSHPPAPWSRRPSGWRPSRRSGGAARPPHADAVRGFIAHLLWLHQELVAFLALQEEPVLDLAAIRALNVYAADGTRGVLLQGPPTSDLYDAWDATASALTWGNSALSYFLRLLEEDPQALERDALPDRAESVYFYEHHYVNELQRFHAHFTRAAQLPRRLLRGGGRAPHPPAAGRRGPRGRAGRGGHDGGRSVRRHGRGQRLEIQPRDAGLGPLLPARHRPRRLRHCGRRRALGRVPGSPRRCRWPECARPMRRPRPIRSP